MLDYKTAGVDIEAGYKSVELMKKHVKETMRPEVLGGLGGFAGAFDLSGIKNMEEPVLLSGTDGCGTKVKLAFVMDKHDTIGIDAVAMCVNDVACASESPITSILNGPVTAPIRVAVSLKTIGTGRLLIYRVTAMRQEITPTFISCFQFSFSRCPEVFILLMP